MFLWASQDRITEGLHARAPGRQIRVLPHLETSERRPDPAHPLLAKRHAGVQGGEGIHDRLQGGGGPGRRAPELLLLDDRARDQRAGAAAGSLYIGSHLMGIIYMCTQTHASISRVHEVSNENASRRAVAPIPEANGIFDHTPIYGNSADCLQWVHTYIIPHLIYPKQETHASYSH